MCVSNFDIFVKFYYRQRAKFGSFEGSFSGRRY